MSAIAGVWYPDGRPGAVEECSRISRALALYGPHRDGIWNGGEIALGHRLMRFLPEDRFDRQPLVGRGGRLHLVADCRIDNREELGRALGIEAGEQALMCDAAFILAALERWGEGALDRLCGDFAFAAWDSDARTLLLARDPVGNRPLHYHAGRGWFAFASMPKGLLALPDVPTGPDLMQLAAWQMLLPLEGPASFHRGVSRIQAGEQVTVRPDGRLDRRRYWNPLALSRRHVRGEADADGLREVLDLAVKAQLRGTGGTALMLSSGLDSAAVASSAAPLLAAEGKRLTAFTSVPMPGTPRSYHRRWLVDEGPLSAVMAARHANIDHHLVHGHEVDFLPVMERMIILADRPVMNPLNTAWMHQIYSQAARAGANVVLTGKAGNLALSYRGEHLLAEHLIRLRWLALWRDAGVLVAEGVHADKVAALRAALIPWIPRGLFSLWDQYSKGTREQASLRPVRFDQLPRLGIGQGHWHRISMLFRPQRWPAQNATSLANRDAGPLNAAANAGYGVDRRDPTADRRVLEFCLTLPADRYLRNGRCKDVFRRAFADRIPPEILENRYRGQQAADWRQILLKSASVIQEELAQQMRVKTCADLVDLEALQALAGTLDQTMAGDRTAYNLHFLKLTRGLSAGLFARRAAGGN